MWYPSPAYLLTALGGDRHDRVALVDGQVQRAPVELARAPVDDPGARVLAPAELEQRELGTRVGMQIGERVAQRLDMARPRREV